MIFLLLLLEERIEFDESSVGLDNAWYIVLGSWLQSMRHLLF